jgi:hypothetical protein
MSKISNHPKRKSKLIRAIRGTLEHRAAWLYLSLDEAQKHGLGIDEFAKKAVHRCGCFQGGQLVARAGTKSLKGLKKRFLTCRRDWYLK